MNSKYHDQAQGWADRYEAGESMRQLSASSGVNAMSIRYWLQKYSVKIRSQAEGRRTRQERHKDFYEEVAQMYYYSGMRVYQIADMYGTSYPTIYDWVHKAGYDVDPKQRCINRGLGPRIGIPEVDFSKVPARSGPRGSFRNLDRYKVAHQLMKDGSAYVEIGELLGVTRQAVGLMVNKLWEWSREQKKGTSL